METKKNKKYDLEHKRPLFFGIGMIISLSLALFAFEWRSEIEPIIIPQEPEDVDWFVLPDPVVTKHNIPKPPKPIKEEKQVVNQNSIIKEVTEELYEEKEERYVDIEEEIADVPVPTELKEEVADQVFIFVEEEPSFPGGDEALLGFIAQNLKYPKRAQRLGIEGLVTLAFVIDKDGSVSDIEVLKGIGAGCDEEAVRVLNQVPKFSPGKQRGKPVKVRMVVPINFKLH